MTKNTKKWVKLGSKHLKRTKTAMGKQVKPAKTPKNWEKQATAHLKSTKTLSKKHIGKMPW